MNFLVIEQGYNPRNVYSKQTRLKAEKDFLVTEGMSGSR